jgi:hypothetical protein
MGPWHALGWAAASVTSAWLTWAAYRGPPPRQAQPSPAALPRLATQAEWSAINRVGDRLTLELRAATARAGRPLAGNELEGTDAAGQAWLPSGIPDNPLVPHVGSIRTECTDLPVIEADWVYCPKAGSLRPGGTPPLP